MEPVRDPEGIETQFLERLVPMYGRTVLEIGCGDGRLIWRYADRAGAIAGVDPDRDDLSQVRAGRPVGVDTPLTLAQAQAEVLPFADEAFGIVLFGWSL